LSENDGTSSDSQCQPPATLLSQVTAVILAGGLGTRLRPVIADQPKALAEVAGRPFLTYIFDQLIGAHVREVVLCTGYLSEHIRAAFGDRYQGLRIFYSVEKAPLGTGGALRLALASFRSDPVLVMNGDSYCDVMLEDFWQWHQARPAVASLLLTQVSDTGRFGRVRVAENGMVTDFAEKGAAGGAGLINSGIYLLGRGMIASIPVDTTVSLEREVFSRLVGCGLYGFATSARFLDIGTPDAYRSAATFFADIAGVKP
jgi:D-glycero-alpha-D-manno-heptose 1-phosphate guanylyltransferase